MRAHEMSDVHNRCSELMIDWRFCQPPVATRPKLIEWPSVYQL
jgi:hypothetical protein